MARFSGKIGFGIQTEDPPGSGSYDDSIIERAYFGDVVTDSVKTQTEMKVNSDLTIGNSFSVVADPYAHEHLFAIRYIEWSGVLWTVVDAKVLSPRLLIRVGGVYSGPTP